jgi:hypothetical protein
MSRPRPKNDADREWQAQKPMRDDLSNAADEDGEADDGHAGLLHHDVHRGGKKYTEIAGNEALTTDRKISK